MAYCFDKTVDRIGTACIKWDFQEADYGKRGLLPFSIADADYRIEDSILMAIKERVEKGVLGYTDVDEAYLDAVCHWFRTEHDWEICPDWILPTNGIVPSISYGLESCTEKNSEVIVQPPVYDPFYSVIQATGRKIVRNHLIQDAEGTYRMDYLDLEEKMKLGAKTLLLCSPHNPVCRVWSREELSKVAELCVKYGVLLLSDEIHWDMALGGRKHHTMGKFNELNEQMIVFTSASKTFNIAGLETSNVIIPGNELREKYRKWLFERYLFVPNVLGLEATKAAYKNGAEWAESQRVFLTENADLVRAFLKEHLPKAKMAEPEGTYLMWIDMTGYGKNSEELIKQIADQGAGLNSGAHYCERFDGFVRMNIACPKEQLMRGLDCIRMGIMGL